MEITITGTPEEIKELFRTDKDSREQSDGFSVNSENITHVNKEMGRQLKKGLLSQF